MTRLELVQALHQECGVSGLAITSTINQTGENLRLVNWLDRAWNEIQTMYSDWNWMLASNILGSGMSFETVNLQTNYPLGTGAGTCGVEEEDFGSWKTDTFRCQTTSIGVLDEQIIAYREYDVWRDLYMIGATRTVAQRPTVFAVAPTDDSICLPPPTATYTITGDYFVKPSAMAADSDEPAGLPSQYHMMIVYRAMQKYGRYEASPEVVSGGRQEEGRLMSTLQIGYLPSFGTAGAIA